MHLLVDIGNTAIKLAWVKNQTIVKQQILDSNKVWTTKTLNQKISFKLITTIIYSSVKPSLTKLLVNLSKTLKLPIKDVQSYQEIKALKINTDTPNALGSDLLINAYGGIIKYPQKDLIIISFGTATTISMIKQNTFEGTIIMPGLKVSADNLFSRAELLKPFNFKYSNKIIGKNTQEAINLGVVNAHLWGVKGLTDLIKQQLKSPLVLITGGNNYQYENFFGKCNLEPNLMFEGMIGLVC